METAGLPGGPALEDRLRSLILNNAEQQPPQDDSSQSLPQQPAQPDHGDFVSNGASQGSAKATRKRPNQAQRRQMSAQLSIPIDTRPQFSHQSHRSHGSYASPPVHPDHHHHPHHHQHGHHGRGSHHGPREPRSATFGPASRENTVTGAPLTGGPFPSRPRHQASLSYHGPMSTPNNFGWQHQPMHPPGLGPPYQSPGMPPLPRVPFDAPSPRHPAHAVSDISSSGKLFNVRPEELRAQAELLEDLCHTVVADAEIQHAEIVEKETFRLRIEQVARVTIADYERNQNGFHDFPPESVQLKCFGSLASGFATKASDMDLGLLSPLSRVQPDAPGSPIPRLIEKAFLELGLGARLLTRTRVPIIKVCETPPEELRLPLLAERAKWERGITEDFDEEEVQENLDPPPVEEVQPEAAPEAQAQDAETTREQKLRRVKQSDASGLSAYYGSVKRALRLLGCRDITHSNVAEFTAEDAKLLNQVCLAFVDGLADSKLRDRLLRYRSLNRYDLTSHLNLRTLLGVYTQIEGEQMVLAWESRPFQEKDPAREKAAESMVRSWRELQNLPDFGRDPMVYQKELQLGVEHLRKIPSIQVLLLSQAHNESATSYCSRATRLFDELAGHSPRTRVDTVLPTLVRQYIAGIWSHGIREQLERFQQDHGVTNLQAIGRRHKSLQLAQEYEICLNKGHYGDEDATKIRRYVEFLRSPPAQAPAAGHAHGAIALSPDAAPLLSQIRLLGDPSKAAPSQPRDRYSSALEFPKSGVGVQCDINFSAHLGIQNTLLLRCYSHCDPRVRPLVLFVKHWAKVRCINSPYRGTLGSYGYALMMLHYLVNVAQPFVCPNLQHLARPPDPNLTPQQIEETVLCKGRDIQFWRDEAEIMRLARDNALTQNRESIGQLLCGFFEYYARGGSPMGTLPCRSFDWGRDVLSLRTHGGLLSKQAKGWTGAKTVVEVKPAAAPFTPPPTATAAAQHADAGSGPTSTLDTAPHAAAPELQQSQQTPAAVEVKEVRYRYLFAIEDPFELDHNIARTVTHAGIVQIRDEFRRAWRIIKNVGRNAVQSQNLAQSQDQSQNSGRSQGMGQTRNRGQGGGWRHEDLLEDVASVEAERDREQFARLLEELHGIKLAEGEGGGEVGKGEGVEGGEGVVGK